MVTYIGMKDGEAAVVVVTDQQGPDHAMKLLRGVFYMAEGENLDKFWFVPPCQPGYAEKLSDSAET